MHSSSSLSAAAFALTVNHYIHLNIGSVKPRLAKVDSLDPAARTFLQDEGIVYLTDLEAGEIGGNLAANGRSIGPRTHSRYPWPR